MWSVCNAINDSFCGPGYATHGQATIADIDNDGALDVVSAIDKHIRVYRASNGALEREYKLGSDSFAPPSAATIAEVGGKTWIVQNTMMERSGTPGRNSGDMSRTWVFTTDTALGAAPWPTFHKDAARTGLDRSGTEVWYPLADPTAFVRQQYRDFLNRTADAGGLAFWTSRMTSGRANGSDLIVQVLVSPEFGRALVPGRSHAPRPVRQAADELQRAGGRTVRRHAAARRLRRSLICKSPTARQSWRSQAPSSSKTPTRWSWGKNATSAQIAAGLDRLNAGATRGTVLASIVNANEAAWHLAVPSQCGDDLRRHAAPGRTGVGKIFEQCRARLRKLVPILPLLARRDVVSHDPSKARASQRSARWFEVAGADLRVGQHE